MPFVKPPKADDSLQTASEALDKSFFLEEFTKLLSSISDKHAMYLTLKQFGDAYGRAPAYAIERELEELQNAVIDSMGALTEHDYFDPMHLHSLLHSVHKDLLSIGFTLEGGRESELYEETDDLGMDDHQAQADIYIQKLGKHKKKNLGKGGRKGSKNMPTKDSVSTSDD